MIGICSAIVIAIILKRKRKKIKRKRIWSKDWFKKKEELGNTKLLTELELNSEADFKNYLRMDKSTFYDLLTKVTPLIQKQTTIMREPISPFHRLAATLRFLASGNSFEDLKFLTAIAPQTIGKIVMETCEAIIEVLKDVIKVS